MSVFSYNRNNSSHFATLCFGSVGTFPFLTEYTESLTQNTPGSLRKMSTVVSIRPICRAKFRLGVGGGGGGGAGVGIGGWLGGGWGALQVRGPLNLQVKLRKPHFFEKKNYVPKKSDFIFVNFIDCNYNFDYNFQFVIYRT